MITQRTFTLKPADAQKKWFHIDATDLVVGRLATEVANILRGKTNPQFTPNTDSGHFVVITNCEKVRFTGDKLESKKYYRHSGYVGGLKTRTAKEQLEKAPEQVITLAVKRMLPKGVLGRKQLTKLKVFRGESHDHQAQNPETITVKA